MYVCEYVDCGGRRRSVNGRRVSCASIVSESTGIDKGEQITIVMSCAKKRDNEKTSSTEVSERKSVNSVNYITAVQ